MNDQLLTDWKECRDAIGRFDNILVDLRKFGFTVCTTLLTADTFLSAGAGGDASQVGSMAVIVTMVLVDALFALDMYYQSLEYGAVRRAVDIENQIGRPIQITKYLCRNVRLTHTGKVTMVLYLALIFAAGGIALAVRPVGSLLPLYVPIIAGLGSVIFIVGYWHRIETTCGFEDSERERPAVDSTRRASFVEATSTAFVVKRDPERDLGRR